MSNNTYQIHESDLLKIRDALEANERFHSHRDLMNADLHLAKDCRFSPITTITTAAIQRIDDLLKGSV